MEVGDAVQFPMGTDVIIIGEVEAMENGAVYVREAHAFHHLWGGSNGARGELHEITRPELIEPASKKNARIVKESLTKWRKKTWRTSYE